MTSVVRFRDLSVPPDERAELLSAIDDVLLSGQIILGSAVEAFEEDFATACEKRYCVGVSDGTGSLYLALRVLGIGPGDEVIVPAMTWVASANAVVALGATPVFVDVDDDYNLDPHAAEAAITSRTRAIMPVHFYGRMARMPEILAVARRTGLRVVEDASQAFGATLNGKPAGSFGDLAGFSLNPMKPLAALGEAGATVTDDEQHAATLRSLRYLGTVNRETCVDPSLNFKIDTLQAVVLRHRMTRVQDIVRTRNAIAARYNAELADVVTVPSLPTDGVSAFFDYTIWCTDRDRLESTLNAAGIEVKVRHRDLLCDQPGYQPAASGDVSNARRLVAGILCLPIHEALSEADQGRVIAAIRSFYGA